MAPTRPPPDFVEIADIDGDKVGRFINVVGIVKDCRLPIPTSGKDHKCTLRICDPSTENSGEGIDVSIFRPEADMPHFGAKDVVVLYKAKVQRYRNDAFVSLLSHHTTKINVYKADKIPKPPNSAKAALGPGPKRDVLQPTEAVLKYVSYVFHQTEAYDVPDDAEFQQKAAASLNVKAGKFRLLEDVSDGTFCDIIAEVSRKPFDAGDKVTLYVSDYTENSGFFHYTSDAVKEIAMRAANDPHGYNRRTQDDESEKKDEWFGPEGKMAIQISCFEPHAAYIRAHVDAQDWVRIRNVQIKYGRNGQNLEGFLREEREHPGRLNIDILPTNDRQNADPRLVDAISRYREYDKKKKKQEKEAKNQLQAAQTAGEKRRRSLGLEQESSKKKSKSQQKRERRRREERLAQQRQEEAPETTCPADDELPETNKSITCESHAAPIQTLGCITRPCQRDSDEAGQKVTLPFVCAKYRACVRVIDFHPSSLEKFACSRKKKSKAYKEFFGDDESSDSDGDTSEESADEGGDNKWEWSFALHLEDARHPTQRVWIVVDNFNGQCLTNLDACDLRRDKETLAKLKKRMVLLWGNLEEKKSEAEAPRKKPVSRKRGILQLERPPDSSDQEDNGRSDGWERQVSNQPFHCCIQQYGVSVARHASSEDDAASSEAAPKQEWTRVFGLFGTKISH